MFVRRPYSLSSLSLCAVMLLGGCADDIGTTVTGGSSGTTEGTTADMQTTGTPTTTVTPTSGDTTTAEGTSTGVVEGSTSTGAVTVTDTDATSTTDPDTSTTDPETSGTSTGSGTTGDTDTGGECVPGEVNCDCLNDSCVGEAVCVQDKCLPFTGQCDFELNFECDEGTLCEPGTDPFDCCPSQQDGICEELGMGGVCAPYSDYYDCGYCVFSGNGSCDEPDFCPVGTDTDCCATEQNGVCEEQGMGGMCEDGTDYYDCGYCPFEQDGACDVPDFCPPDTDVQDCCATPGDATCEEQQFGGMCEDGSDFFDCGYCPFEQDGFCDAPDFCPPDTDVEDCCATPEDAICEEMQFGGMCEDGSDFFDCGYCPFEQDGFCDAPFFCPEGTDEADCCITTDDGICDELALGGTCPDGQDFYDCGYCPYEDDLECDVPFICPEDTDVNDCQ